MRLINADELIASIDDRRKKHDAPFVHPFFYSCGIHDGYASALSLIINTPTVDAVPVVRCKDCEHYRNGICEKIEYIMDGYYHGTFDVKRPDDFCSYGVKKSGGGENAVD